MSRTAVPVALVGAGPGDPELITLKGLRRLRRADVLVYDRLVADELVAKAPAGCLSIPRADLDQDEVNELLVEHGRGGGAVVRLKGGDPFVFGRGGEEALALLRAGIPFEVVPGVSTIAAVPAAAGIPVTHRGLASQLTVVTARGAGGEGVDCETLARVDGTLLVFMGLSALAAIAGGLIAAGADPEVPAAVVSCGTTARQQVVEAPLERIAAAAGGLASPALLVVGDVVSLRAELTGRLTTAFA